jgi:hypothetical protein
MANGQNFKKVAIHGVPRSGTSWVGEILNSSPHTAYRYQPLFSYSHKDYLNNASASDDIDQFFKRLYHCDDNFTNQKEMRKSGNFPNFRKAQITHVIYKEVRYINILFNMMRKTEDVVLCAVIRNPLSVINSWLNAPREFRRDLGWSEIDEWRYALKKNLNRPEEFHGYEKWKEAANIFIELLKVFPNRVYIIEYSTLLMNPIEESKRIFNFLNLKITNQTKRFISDSTNCVNQDEYAVFRKDQSDDKWKIDLDTEIAKEIHEDLKGTYLERFI